MSATYDNQKDAAADPSALERQADQIRADMDRTLGALERKFSPEQVLERSLGYLRDHSTEITQTLGASMKNNPVPVVMTLAGLTWLVASSYNSRQPPGRDLQSRFASSGVGQKLQQRTATARERLQTSTSSARERFSSTRGEASGRVSGALHSARDNTRMRAQQMQSRVYGMMDEQPLVLGALAVAVGAIIGAAIPSTQYENRVLGQARERALSKAQQVGEQQYEQVKESLESQGTTGRTGSQSGASSEPLSGRA